MYWIAQSKDDLGPRFIQSSDFLNETFTSVWPLLLDYNPLHTNALSVYNHNRLSLIHQRQNTNVIDVWVENPLAEEAVAWNHVFTVANEGLPYLHRYYDIGYLVHFLDKKKHSCCDVHGTYWREEQGQWWWEQWGNSSNQVITESWGRNTRTSKHRTHNFLWASYVWLRLHSESSLNLLKNLQLSLRICRDVPTLLILRYWPQTPSHIC